MSIPELNLSEQPAHVRLQILFAKIRLSPSEVRRANALLHEVEDWPAFLDVAARNFNLPLMRRHLSMLDQSPVPQKIRDQLGAAANMTAFRNMEMISAQKRFQDACLKPLGVRGIFFKGVSMAAQYYPDLGLRPCRDIDVLVPKGTLGAILNKAVEAGYTPVSPDIHAVPLTSARDINAILRFGGSASMVTPERAVIDLQDHLDKHSGIFSGYDLEAQVETCTIAGERFNTLPVAFLFNYICHHHTRHTWSRLHWLSDLDALCVSDGFDTEATLALADRLGQRGTVEASLELHRLMSTDTDWDDSDDLERGKTFLKLCILNLPGDLDLEKQLGLQMLGGEFMYDWQVRPELIDRARRRWWLSIFRPTVSQYARMPLPKALQFIYYIARPFELFYLAQKRARALKR
jgi:hypothetical protein